MKFILTTLIMAFVFLSTNAQTNPTIDQVSDQIVDEDATEQTIGLTGITDGGDGGQELTVEVSSNNSALFSRLEIVEGASTSLVFQSAADANGSAIVTVSVTDEDGTTDMSFTITVNPVNDPPTIDLHDNVTVNEDVDFVLVQLTGISAGPANENQDLIFTFYSSNQSLVDRMTFDYTSGESEGTLTIYVFSDSVGVSNIQIQVIDDDILNAATIDFDLTVLPVNDAPTLDAIDDVVIENDGLEHTIDLTGISEGPANETDQTLTFTLSNDNNTLFSDLSIDYAEGDITGVLKYTPVLGEQGEANVTVRLSDNGGTLNGGTDYFEQTFLITINNTATAVTPDQDVRLFLYPNPVRNLLRVTLPVTVSGEVTVEVYSVNGEKVLNKTYSESRLQIPVSSLSTGWYQIRVTAGENAYSGRFLVK